MPTAIHRLNHRSWSVMLFQPLTGAPVDGYKDGCRADQRATKQSILTSRNMPGCPGPYYTWDANSTAAYCPLLALGCRNPNAPNNNGERTLTHVKQHAVEAEAHAYPALAGC